MTDGRFGQKPDRHGHKNSRLGQHRPTNRLHGTMHRVSSCIFAGEQERIGLSLCLRPPCRSAGDDVIGRRKHLDLGRKNQLGLRSSGCACSSSLEGRLVAYVLVFIHVFCATVLAIFSPLQRLREWLIIYSWTHASCRGTSTRTKHHVSHDTANRLSFLPALRGTVKTLE